MSLGTQLAPMLNTLRDIKSEFKANGAENYTSSTISKTVGPAGTQKFSKKTNIKDGIGKETTVETSLNAQGQGKQCTEQKTLKDGKIIDTSKSCQRVKTQNQRGQQPSTMGQQQNPPGQQVDPMGQQVDPPGQQQSPMGQKQKRKIQTQNLPGQQTNNSLNTNDYFKLPQ